MQPVFRNTIVRNMVVSLRAVAGQEKQLPLFSGIFAVVNFYIAFAAHYVIKLIIAGGYVSASPAAPAPCEIPRQVFQLDIF